MAFLERLTVRWEVIDLKKGDYVRLLKPISRYPAGTIGQILQLTNVFVENEPPRPTVVVAIGSLFGGWESRHVYVYADPNEVEPVPAPRTTTLHIDAARWDVYQDTPIKFTSDPDRDVFHFNFETFTYWVENAPIPHKCSEDNPSRFRRKISGGWEFNHPGTMGNSWNSFSGTDSNQIDREYRKYARSVTSSRWEIYPDTIVKFPADPDTYHFDFSTGIYWTEDNASGEICSKANPSQFKRLGPQDWQYKHQGMNFVWQAMEASEAKILEEKFQQYNRDVTSSLRWEVVEVMTVKLPPYYETYKFDLYHGTYWNADKQEGRVTEAYPSMFRRKGPHDWQYSHGEDVWIHFDYHDQQVLEKAYQDIAGTTASLWEIESEEIQVGDRVRVKKTDETYQYVQTGWMTNDPVRREECVDSLFSSTGVVEGQDVETMTWGMRWKVRFPRGTPADASGAWYIPGKFLEIVDRP